MHIYKFWLFKYTLLRWKQQIHVYRKTAERRMSLTAYKRLLQRCHFYCHQHHDTIVKKDLKISSTHRVTALVTIRIKLLFGISFRQCSCTWNMPHTPSTEFGCELVEERETAPASATTNRRLVVGVRWYSKRPGPCRRNIQSPVFHSAAGDCRPVCNAALEVHIVAGSYSWGRWRQSRNACPRWFLIWRTATLQPMITTTLSLITIITRKHAEFMPQPRSSTEY